MATTPTPVVPTISAKTFITDIPTAIAYVIRHFVSSPKSINETLYQFSISMPDIISRNPGDPNAICNATSAALSQVFNNIYGTSSTTVTCTPITTDNINYNIEINVSVTYNGQNYTILNTVTTDSQGRLVLEGNKNE